MRLRTTPPRPVATRTTPSYPRLLLATTLALSGCALYSSDATPSPGPAGAAEIPFDAGDASTDTPRTDAGDAATDACPVSDAALPEVQSDGFAPMPYDAAPDADGAAEVSAVDGDEAG